MHERNASAVCTEHKHGSDIMSNEWLIKPSEIHSLHINICANLLSKLLCSAAAQKIRTDNFLCVK